ncbi:sulfite reductase flavoprotein subunit alpha [Cupriavidus gilardii]|nr:sulfite reductase flavoprotein subunit alpha [Cupriavidus gilardii]
MNAPRRFGLASPAKALGALTAISGLAGVSGLALSLAGAGKWPTAGGVALAYAGFCGAIFALHRRRRQGSAAFASTADDATLIAYASQTGFAEQLALQTAQALQHAGLPVRVASFADLDPSALARCRQALFVASTTGEGDAPDSAAGFTRKLAAASGDGLRRLRYGILALGDSSYANFCAYGHALSAALQRAQAQRLFDLVEVDNGDTGALRHWQNHLSALAGGAEIADWEAPRYGRWRLVERRLMNPGSAGAPAFHLALEPESPAALDWQAGDIAEIGPRLPPAQVAQLLRDLSLDGGAAVRCDGEAMPLADALAARMPLPAPHAEAMRGLSPQALIDALPPLPHREYSIASLPTDGRLDLLVRQTRHEDGRLGLASGWLTEHAPLGAPIALRVRTNRAFHAPADDRPLLLIGNGTGMAGLRALLKARAAAGHRRNWLLFGERSAAHDAFYREELQAWQADGTLPRLDRTWSRDGAPLRYVQDAVRAAAPQIREWVAAGAAIYVCGSLQGMAAGVNDALAEVLGTQALAALAENGRYRRDVY